MLAGMSLPSTKEAGSDREEDLEGTDGKTRGQGHQPHDQGEGAVHAEPQELRHVQKQTDQGQG